MSAPPRIAVLIPCFNEAESIADVIAEFRSQLPDATIYVYDNNSTDRTAEIAKENGAVVRRERRQGKGFVIRTMFQRIDADVYIMVDGDGTYPAHRVWDLVEPILSDDADMVIGSRLHPDSKSQFKHLNRFGNKFFLFLLAWTFSVRVTDLLSGYRAFNRRVVKALPLLSRGFEIETELTLKAAEHRCRIAEVPVDLSPRKEGSFSKIKIVRDGLLIVQTIFSLLRDYKPLTTFGSLGLLLLISGLVMGGFPVMEYLETGAVYRIPLAVLSVGTVLSGVLTVFVGIILHTISRRFQEVDAILQNISDRVHDLPRR